MAAWHDDLPDDVELVSDEGKSFRLRMSMPADEENRMVVRCPMDPDHRFAIALRFEGESTDEIYCVACGHKEGVDAFLTDEMRQRITEIALAIAAHQIGDKMRAMGLKYQPNPIPKTFFTYEQEKTRRTMYCARCDESVAVFGPAFFCPGCGRLAPVDQFAEQLAVERRIIDGLAGLPHDALAQLEADGGLTTIYEGSIKNTATAIEVFMKAVFQEQVANADAVLKAEKRGGNVFQRLGDVDEIFRDHVGVDLPATLADKWDMLRENMATRHILTHNSGIVDQKYLDQVPMSPLRVGQRIVVSRSRVQDLLNAATALGDLLAPATAAP